VSKSFAVLPQVELAVAWGGGAAFVGALAYGVYFFVVTLGRSADDGATLAAAITINSTLFSLFAAHHSIMARPGAKRWLTEHVTPFLERSCFVWVSALLFFVTCIAWQPVPGELWRLEGWWRWTAHAVQLSGVALVAISARVIDPLELAGIQSVRDARHPEGANRRRRAKTLSESGPYGLVRHPIYLGTLLAAAASPDLTGGRLLFTTLMTVYIVLAMPWEERSLVEQYGEAYRGYRRAVRWRLIPGVY
jgi:uncharacterized membrane protein